MALAHLRHPNEARSRTYMLKSFLWEKNHKTFQFILLGIAMQGQRICSAEMVGTILKENSVFYNRFIHNMNKYSWIFEQVFLPALALMFSCWVFSKQNC